MSKSTTILPPVIAASRRSIASPPARVGLKIAKLKQTHLNRSLDIKHQVLDGGRDRATV